MSHPTWVRGLKQIFPGKEDTRPLVAPYVGAWIETFAVGGWLGSLVVAPYVGAWIETALNTTVKSKNMSHPTWVRGLKQQDSQAFSLGYKSHPTWVRGLKLYMSLDGGQSG